MFLDKDAIRIGGIKQLIGSQRNCQRWLDKLEAAGLRHGSAAVLALFDGDADQIEGSPFCAYEAAKMLVSRAKQVGAGQTFSLACVLARQEFESWLIAGVESLAGQFLPDGREAVESGVTCEGMDVEENPRGAKAWLGARMLTGYRETTHQVALTEMVSLERIRTRNPRSFRRLETALDQLIAAVRNRTPIISPA
jgi:hypothetical protein